MKRPLAVLLTLLLLAAGIIAAPNASAACQGSIGCDSGWQSSTYYEPSSQEDFNQNIEVIWYTSNIHRIYLSGSTCTSIGICSGMSYMQIYYRVHPNGSWILRETIQPGPAYGSYTNRQYAGWPDRSARDWVVKACSFGSCFNTPVVYN